jgi:MULE transposase domain
MRAHTPTMIPPHYFPLSISSSSSTSYSYSYYGIRSLQNAPLIEVESPTNKENQKNYEEGNAIAVDKQYKPTRLHNGRRANRKDGKTAPRRRDTKGRTDPSEPRCPFRISVFSDGYGFFLNGGTGCAFHRYHARFDHTALPPLSSTRLLAPDERQFICDVNKARTGNTANRNLFYVRGGKFLSVEQCRRICGADSNSAKNINDDEYDVSQAFKEFFEKKKADCLFLYHKPNELLSELHEGSAEQVTSAVFDHTTLSLSDEELRRTESYALSCRSGQGLLPSQDIMLALAWVLPFDKKLFNLFPFVIHLDSTNATNRENRPLFTMSLRDTFGKQHIFFRALIPNECSWTFKWLFQTVMPRLLGQPGLNRVVLAITDGDPNEIMQLDDAIRNCIPNAARGRCIWHIIDRGMEQARYYPKFPSRHRKGNEDYAQYKRLRELVRRWMWSWAGPRCESKEEYELSKALFTMSMKRKDVGLIIDPTRKKSDDASCVVLDFLRGHVEPHEQHFAEINACFQNQLEQCTRRHESWSEVAYGLH